jgi:hypothetical protein
MATQPQPTQPEAKPAPPQSKGVAAIQWFCNLGVASMAKVGYRVTRRERALLWSVSIMIATLIDPEMTKAPAPEQSRIWTPDA